jgi:RNase P protein component
VGEILPKIKEGLKVVFLVKKVMLEASDEEIGKEIKKGLEKI